MFDIYVKFFAAAIMLLSSLILGTAFLKTRDTSFLPWGIGFLAVGLLSGIHLFCTYDKLAIDAAQKFFDSRESVYSCENLKDLQCQYSIKEWIRDSIEWSERVKVIMEMEP